MNSDPDHRYLQTSVLLFSGVWLFFMIERFLKIIMDWKEKKNQLKRVVSNPAAALGLIAESPGPVSALSADVEKIYESQEQVIKASFGHQAVTSEFLKYDFKKIIILLFLYRNHKGDIAMNA
jgi:hypothetical protein